MAEVSPIPEGQDAKLPEDKYQLTYFNFRGIAEPIRFIFKLKGIPFEDVRLEKDDTWITEHKHKYPYGVLPALKINGTVMGQSLAITRYLARKYNLVGENDMEAALCDEIVDSMADLRVHWRAYWRETTDFNLKLKLKEAFIQEHCPIYFEQYTHSLYATGGNWLVSRELTWADLYIAHFLDFFQRTVDPKILDDYPRLVEFKDEVFSIPQIKAWVAVRPETIL